MTQIYSKYFSCEDGTGWVDGEGCAPASVAQKFRQINCRLWSIQYCTLNFHCSWGAKIQSK